MTRPRHESRGTLIALSPYRAQLGRGRRLRRGDALLEAPDPEAAIRALPGDELYYVVHELGLRDADGILACATAEQLQVVLDFALWQRDQIDNQQLGEWLEVLVSAPFERIGEWLAGLDSELVGIVLRRAMRIYDVAQEEPPDEPEGTFFPTPDRLFVLDVTGIDTGRPPNPGDEQQTDAAQTAIRLIEACYRADKDLARRMLVAARGEMDSELEETAYRWRQGRMADLGFADYYDALEVYRVLDPASVSLARDGEGAPPRSVLQPGRGSQPGPDALRVPTALAARLGDVEGSPFARAAQGLRNGDEVEELHHALVALTNRVLAADRVAPGDDETVTVVLNRLAATLDLAIDYFLRLPPESDGKETQVLRAIPLVRLFRLGFTLTDRVRQLALTLNRQGPFGRYGPALLEPDDATVIEAITAARPSFPRLLDQPAAAGERPFQSMADIARVTAALERAAAAQAMLRGLGVAPQDLAPGGELDLADGELGDAGVLARTALVLQVLSRTSSKPSIPIRPLDPDEVRRFEAQLRTTAKAPMKLPASLKKKVKAILDALAPKAIAGAAEAVAERWIAGLAPLEPVLVRKPKPQKPRRR